jgi:hypothetical protein
VSQLNHARAHIILCDAAQAIGGKLFILGGGWSKVWGPGPYSFALAVQLWLPWNQANERKALRISLVTEDGQAVNAPDGRPVLITGEVEAGRPPGVRPGSDLDVAVALPVTLPIPPGQYRWNLELAGDLLTSVAFEVLLMAPPGIVPGAIV